MSEEYLQFWRMEGSREEWACVCECLEMERDQEKQYLLKTTTSIICSYLTITQFEMNRKFA